MPQVFRSLSQLLIGWVLCLVFLMPAAAAQAFNNPELLPQPPTPVVDLGKSLTSTQEQSLTRQIEQFEADTGWKLRVLTQFDRTPGSAVKQYWGLDDKSILLVADGRGGNILNFSVGEAAYQYLPRTFWIELQTRFGNQFYVREYGEDQAIIQALSAVETCLRQQGCRFVPGLPREQWLLTLVTSILGGLILGFTAQPRQPGQWVAWQWALVFSPLWGILFIAFGIGPVVSRTTDLLPLVRNVAGFTLGTLLAYFLPLIRFTPEN